MSNGMSDVPAPFKVLGHFENASTGKKFDTGLLQFLVSVPERNGINYEGGYDPDPVSVNSVLASHGKIPSGMVFVIDGWANLDAQHQNPVNILS
jgi:uncharacterized protein YggL (DUF469 family)